MKSIHTAIMIIVVLLFATSVIGGEDPNFFKETYPTHALKGTLEARKTLNGPDAQLDAKTRELISLGVAAQIPCSYCVYIHKKNARAAGASEAEIREAVAAAAETRHWSTVLNGMDYDLEDFKAEVDKIHSTK